MSHNTTNTPALDATLLVENSSLDVVTTGSGNCRNSTVVFDMFGMNRTSSYLIIDFSLQNMFI